MSASRRSTGSTVSITYRDYEVKKLGQKAHAEKIVVYLINRWLPSWIGDVFRLDQSKFMEEELHELGSADMI